MASLSELESAVSRLSAKAEYLASRACQLEEQQVALVSRLEVISEAQAFIQSIAQQTQSQLQAQLSQLSSIAMSAVFDDPYAISVEFVERRSKTECDITFTRDGISVDPLSAAGGGAVDIAALALRLSLWGMMPNKTRPIFILDEPLRFLSASYQQRAADLLAYLAETLGVQIIMVTHNETFIESATTQFKIVNVGGVRIVGKWSKEAGNGTHSS